MGVLGGHRRLGASCRSDQWPALRCVHSVANSRPAWHGGHRICGVGSQSSRRLLCRGRPDRPDEAGTYSTDDAPYPGAYLRPFPRQNGGAGLVSTLPDMVALIRSLLPGGPTLLKPDTIELMMTNQLPKGVWLRFAAFGELRGKGHGLAGALILEPSAFDHQDARGELFWGGRAGTQWWISPKKNTAGLIMAQRERLCSSICGRVQTARVQSGEAQKLTKMALRALHESALAV